MIFSVTLIQLLLFKGFLWFFSTIFLIKKYLCINGRLQNIWEFVFKRSNPIIRNRIECMLLDIESVILNNWISSDFSTTTVFYVSFNYVFLIKSIRNRYQTWVKKRQEHIKGVNYELKYAEKYDVVPDFQERRTRQSRQLAFTNCIFICAG